MGFYRIFYVLFFVLGLIPQSGANEEEVEPCFATREYVTALGFLRENKDFELPEAQARELADYVSRGCSGAARRFIQITNLLVRSGLSSRDAILEAKRMSLEEDAVANTFISVYRGAYLRKYLDLDIASSLKLARTLSLEFEGDPLEARKDFQKLVRFCTRSKGLDLPLPQCGEMAARVTRLGTLYEKGVAEDFIRLVQFIRTHPRGPQQTLHQALTIAEEVVSHGTYSARNFIQGYRYAVSEKGLQIPAGEALYFAKKMAARSVADQRFIASEKKKKAR